MQNPPKMASVQGPSASCSLSLMRATRRVAVLDYLRVPYEVAYDDREDRRLVVVQRGSASVCWPASFALGGASAGFWRLNETVVAGRVVSDAAADEMLGPDWEPVAAVNGGDGATTSSVRHRADGRIFLPFDPDEMVLNLWSEAYGEFATSGGKLVSPTMRRLYYRLRPVIPRALQLALRRRAVRFQRQAQFPRWPVEPSLHDMYDLLLELLGDPDDPVPWIAPWPAPYRWAVVLTHDVETSYGLARMSLLRDVELEAGFRSSWNLVPRRYTVSDDVVAELTQGGFEVGVHGLHHDGRDLESAEFERRLPEIRRWAGRWGAVGFRAPATHRVWESMPKLAFEYDSSYPDTDPFEPMAGGCCSWFPYTNGSMVELPITLPQDHTLYEILRVPALGHWCSKADAIRERGGMALLITHPDYMVSSERLDDYRDFLAHTSSEPGAWRVLPRDVSAWWQRRARSSLVGSANGWSISGPAEAEAALAYGPVRRVLT